ERFDVSGRRDAGTRRHAGAGRLFFAARVARPPTAGRAGSRGDDGASCQHLDRLHQLSPRPISGSGYRTPPRRATQGISRPDNVGLPRTYPRQQPWNVRPDECCFGGGARGAGAVSRGTLGEWSARGNQEIALAERAGVHLACNLARTSVLVAKSIALFP